VNEQAGLRALGMAGEWEGCLEVLLTILPQGRTEAIYEAVITACGRMGRWQEAMVVFNAVTEGGKRTLGEWS